jgi:hypothetical protein
MEVRLVVRRRGRADRMRERDRTALLGKSRWKPATAASTALSVSDKPGVAEALASR